MTFTTVFAQSEYVNVGNKVYTFLERLETLHIINGYNGYSLPKRRKEIAYYIGKAYDNKEKLNKTDRELLNEFLIEFEFDINRATNNQVCFFSSEKYNPFSEKEKYVYFYADTSGSSLFINLNSLVKSYYAKNNIENSTYNLNSGNIGGEIRGTIINKFGFSVKASNGKANGDRFLTDQIPELASNYKFNETKEGGSGFYDHAEGYFNIDLENVCLKIGNDRQTTGYGDIKALFGKEAPNYDYIGLNIAYKFLTFDFKHGKLLGSQTVAFDSLQGTLLNIEDKHFAYHRLGFNVSRHLNFGIGEIIVYSRRGIDLSYLNPFNFYKTAEHANIDRDNAILIFDVANNTIQGFKLSFETIIDDIDFAKINEDWYGNKMAYNLSAVSSNLYQYVPIDLKFQYLKIDPYVFSHRIVDNNFVNNGYSLNHPLSPNSVTYYLGINYYPFSKLEFEFNCAFTKHGANELDSNLNIVRNVGGDVLVGHRTGDSEKVKFLDGNLIRINKYETIINYEPWNNIIFGAKASYLVKNDSQKESEKVILLNAYMSLKL